VVKWGRMNKLTLVANENLIDRTIMQLELTGALQGGRTARNQTEGHVM
jgi:hypothetical protein